MGMIHVYKKVVFTLTVEAKVIILTRYGLSKITITKNRVLDSTACINSTDSKNYLVVTVPYLQTV